MTFRKMTGPALMVALLTGAMVLPALAQNRFMDEAKDAAARRSENRAVREAEHPPANEPAEATPPAQPAETQAAAAAPAPAEQSAAPVEQAPPAQPAPAVQPPAPAPD